MISLTTLANIALPLAQENIRSDKGSPIALIMAVVLALTVIIFFFWVLSRYRRCPSNKILVIYGKTGSGASRCVHGGAAFIWPVLQDYQYMDLEPFVVPIDLTNALSQENIRVAVPTTVTAAISTQSGIMQSAAIRLLALTRAQIQAQAQDIILGQMRAVIATMKIEDINRDRQGFMGRVNEAVGVELEKIGLTVINVNIRDIEDESGYIKALGRKAAAEAINTANIEVAEQERIGQIGVAMRQRDNRVAVAAAQADAEIGEANAARNKRQQTANLDAQAVSAETEAGVQKAGYHANQLVAEQSARNRSESAARTADGEIRVAQETANKKAEDAKALREQSRLNAEVVVPAQAQQQQVIIAAEAVKQQTIRVAEGEAAGNLAKMTAVAQGTQKQLEAKAEGYLRLVTAARDPQALAALLIIEKLADVAGIQAQAIKNLPIEKIVIWDSGSKDGGGLSGLGQRIMGALPPIHELAKQIGLELPGYLGTMKNGFAGDTPKDAKPTDGPKK
jgi:flotillin